MRMMIIMLISIQVVPGMICHAKEDTMYEEEALYAAGKTIENTLKPYIGSTIEGAAVAVVKDNEIIYSKGFGYADQKQEKEVEPQNTIFEYGSVSKLFVWTAVMQLAEQGKLDWNQDIRQYLPETFDRKFQYEDTVTMLNLMNHTAGFDDYIIGLFNQKDELIGLKEWLEETDVRQVRKPGEQCVYSNYGAALAAFVVEQVSGMEFRDYVKEFIYQKAGLKQIYPESILPESMAENKSKAYTSVNSELKEAKDTYISAYPAGAMNGTVEELAHFAMALMQENSPLFNKDSTRDEFFETSWKPEHGMDGTGMSHGFFQYPSDERVLWHNGETMNFSSFFLLIPDKKLAVCMVCNTGGKKVLEAERKVAFSFAPEWSVQTEGEVTDVDSLEGKYRSLRRCHHGISKLLYILSPFDKVVTANEDGTITVAKEQYQQVRQYVFYCKDSKRTLCFGTDSKGNVTDMYQLVGYEKISGFSYGMWFVKLGLLLITFVIALLYGIRKRGWYRRITAFLVLLIVNIAVIAWRAMQLCYFSSLTVWIGVNILFTAVIFIMLALQIKDEWKKEREKEKEKDKEKEKEKENGEKKGLKKEKGWIKNIVLFDSSVIGFLMLLGSFGIYEIAG